MNMQRVRHGASIVALGLLATACGGSDSGSDPTPPAPVSALTAACSGAFCGAASNTRYSGEGVGVWSYTNASDKEASIPVALENVGQRAVTLVYTNPNAPGVQMPALTLTPATTAKAQQDGDAHAHRNQIPEAVRQFDAAAHLGKAGAGQAKAATTKAAVGAQRTWYINADNGMEQRTATLKRQKTFADGRVINLWLEDAEAGAGKMTDAMLDTFMERFARPANSVYGLVSGLAGQPWGAHAYNDLIAAEQPIDIVFVNFVPDGKPYGLLGYFWALNNLKANPSDEQLKYSNESLSFYMDTETVYLDLAKGMDMQISTLAHEFVHMVNFYQRRVLRGMSYGFTTFLEEMSAVMVEDVLGERITPGYNTARDEHVPAWLARSGFNCDPTEWSVDKTCFGYNVVGAYGAYLLRQYGVGFYQQMLKNTSSTDSWTVLDNAITTAGGPGLAGTLPRWGASIALLPGAASPQGYGYPQRNDASGFTLVGINGPDYAPVRQLPSTVPPTLAGHGHFPLTRQANDKGVYQEQLSVPQGTTLTVIVQ